MNGMVPGLTLTAGTITAQQVTIITAGNNYVPLGLALCATFDLRAATTAHATNGQIPGLAFASKTLPTSGGSSASLFRPSVWIMGFFDVAGLLYLPTSQVQYGWVDFTSSTPSLGGTIVNGWAGTQSIVAGCSQVIAASVINLGVSRFQTDGCHPYGLPGYAAPTTTTSVAVVR